MISFVIVYENNTKQLLNTLNRFDKLYLNKYSFEVIIVDNDKINPLTDSNILDKSYVRIISLSKNDKNTVNHCIAYNRGFAHVKGDVVIIQHAECIHYTDILFIEAHGSYSNVFTSTKFFTVTKTIKSLIQNFPESFIRVHRSYLINLGHVKSYCSEEVIMNNETKIKIARTKKLALIEAIQKTA